MKNIILATFILASGTAHAISAGGHGGHATAHAAVGHATGEAHATVVHPTAAHAETSTTVKPIIVSEPAAPKLIAPQAPKEETGRSSGYPYYNQPMFVHGSTPVTTCDKSKDKDCK